MSNRIVEYTPRRCWHGINRDEEWCELCFRKEQRARWGYSPWDYCDWRAQS